MASKSSLEPQINRLNRHAVNALCKRKMPMLHGCDWLHYMKLNLVVLGLVLCGQSRGWRRFAGGLQLTKGRLDALFQQ